MSVLAHDVRENDISREQNLYVFWPPVHVGHCLVAWNSFLIDFGGFTTIAGGAPDLTDDVSPCKLVLKWQIEFMLLLLFFVGMSTKKIDFRQGCAES